MSDFHEDPDQGHESARAASRRAPGRHGVWRQYTVRDGLADMKVECLCEDSRGRLWVGMHNGGLALYDQGRFEVVAPDVLPDGVFSILEAPDGDLWLGTRDGIWRLRDGEAEQVPGAARSFLWGSCVDSAGHLWFGAERRGEEPLTACCWDGERLHSVAAPGDPPGSIHAIVLDADGRLWLGGYGLYRCDGEGLVPVAQDMLLFSLLPRRDGSLWTGTAHGVQLIGEGGPRPVSGAPLHAWSMLEDDAGVVWVADYHGGVYRRDGEDWNLVRHLGARITSPMCLDQWGRLWVGTNGLGLYCCDDTRFRVWRTGSSSESGRVNCLHRDRTGTLWAGTARGLVEVRDDEIVRGAADETADPPDVMAVRADRAGRVWVGIDSDAGLMPPTWYQEGAYREAECEGDAPLFYVLESFVEDDDGRMWFADRWGQGWGCWENGQVTMVAPDVDHPRFVGALEVEPGPIVWVGSYDERQWAGVCRYDGHSFEHAIPMEASVRALKLLADGELWIGTTRGAACFARGKLRWLTGEDGLSHRIVTAVCQSADGVVWLATEGGGVCGYDGETVQVVEVPGEPALNVVQDMVADDEGLWLATEGGLVRFLRQTTAPQVAITAVEADRTYEPGEEIRVPRNVGVVRIRARGWSPADAPEELLYRFRLAGVDEGWQRATGDTIEVGDLVPGEQVIEVQAVDRDLNYSEAAQVRITVLEDPYVEAVASALAQAGEFFIGRSPGLLQVLDSMARVAETDATVLLLGETGTGKGMAARRIHHLSPRRNRPFVHVNCGALPEGLVESELFGHERGAYTGAVERALGRLEVAHGGTLFLDEVADLPARAQVALLRVLDTHCLRRLGGERDIEVDVRVVAATNRDMAAALRDGTFREDLYYRISAFTATLPPVRERSEDIALLVRYFVEGFARELNRALPQLDPQALSLLEAYGWPGNVRELEHVIQRAVLLCESGPITAAHLSGIGAAGLDEAGTMLTMDELERAQIERALDLAGGKVYGDKGAAVLLGMHAEKLRYRMRRLGIRKPR